MNEVVTSYEYLVHCGAFGDRIEVIKYLMLRLINEKSTGIGAWDVQARLQDMGIQLSTATAGRYLKELDTDGYTNKISNKGRVLTEKGTERLEALDMTVTSSIMHKNVQESVIGSEYKDLIDIYAVRIGIENEAVKLCCRYATDEELANIEKLVLEYEQLAEKGEDFMDASLDFHVSIARATRNKFMESFLTMLIFEQKRIELGLKKLTTRDEGKLFSSQHADIYKSICRRDEKKAVELMQDHFKSIMDSMNNS